MLLLRCLLLPVLVRSVLAVSSSNQLPSIRALSGRARTLVVKILGDLPGLHARLVTAKGLDFEQDQRTEMELMRSSLGIPLHPVLKPPSDLFTLDVCVSRMMSGAQLYQDLLQVLSQNRTGLDDLRADLRDLHTHISKMHDSARLRPSEAPVQNLPVLVKGFHDDYQVQLATNMVLLQLETFCQDLMRSLRAVATYRLHLLTTPDPRPHPTPSLRQ